MVTIKDIAERAGVAKSTVSRYLNNGYVSEETRKKLDQAVAETGYRPNTFARSLKAQRTNMIGVIIPRLDSPSTNDVLTGIDRKTRESDYQLLITNSDQSESRELENMAILIKQKVAGIIMLAREVTDKLVATIKSSPVPVIILGQEIKGVHSIVHDDYDAGFRMGEYAISLGHREFLFVGVTSRDYAVGVLRKKGFEDAVVQAGGRVKSVETTFSRQTSYEKAIHFLKDNTATFVACATDNIAVGTLKAAHELGYQVPKDFSLCGFGGYDATNFVFPTITTVRYLYYDLGEVAVESLEQILEGKVLPDKIMLPNHLIVNHSTTENKPN